MRDVTDMILNYLRRHHKQNILQNFFESTLLIGIVWNSIFAYEAAAGCNTPSYIPQGVGSFSTRIRVRFPPPPPSLHYGRVSYCDDSLLRTLSSRTEHSRLVAHHCRNSSALSLLSALLALFRCACVSSFSILVQFFSVDFDFFHPWRPSKRQKRRKNPNSWRHILSWCLLNHGLGLLQQNKKLFDWYFFLVICVIFYIPNSLN